MRTSSSARPTVVAPSRPAWVCRWATRAAACPATPRGPPLAPSVRIFRRVFWCCFDVTAGGAVPPAGEEAKYALTPKPAGAMAAVAPRDRRPTAISELPPGAPLPSTDGGGLPPSAGARAAQIEVEGFLTRVVGQRAFLGAPGGVFRAGIVPGGVSGGGIALAGREGPE